MEYEWDTFVLADELLIDTQWKSTTSSEYFTIALIDEVEFAKNCRKRFTVAY